MDYQHEQVLAFMKKAQQETPKKPIVPSPEIRQLRARLILEEALETINKGLGISISLRQKIASGSDATVTVLIEMEGTSFIHTDEPDLIELTDGCADLKVVTVGTEIACGIDGEPIFNEVMRSNMSKFIDGHKDSSGKWIKGPSYSPANLQPIIESQSL